MIALILSVVTGAATSLTMRLSTGRVKNRYSMLAGNYFMCLLLAGYYLWPAAPLPRHDALPLTLGIGVVNGMIYLAGFMLIQRNTREHGVVLTSVFSRLGILVPTVLSVLLFGEQPTLVQGLGFGLAIAAILLISMEKGTGLGGVRPALLWMLLVNGSADGMAKVYEEVGSADLSEHFLVYTFLFALLFNLAVVLHAGERPGLVDLGFGLLIGIPNYFVARFLLQAVAVVPAVIVYPTYSVGSILLVTLAGVLFFREKISRRQAAAIGIILAALVLLNL